MRKQPNATLQENAATKMARAWRCCDHSKTFTIKTWSLPPYSSMLRVLVLESVKANVPSCQSPVELFAAG